MNDKPLRAGDGRRIMATHTWLAATEGRVAAGGWKALERYLGRVCGATCLVPLEQIRQLGGVPEAVMSPEWWTDASGWPQCPASGACRKAGWEVESVHRDGFVRFGRIAGA